METEQSNYLSRLVKGVTMVLVSCFLNVFVLELIIRQDPKAGTAITFFQFLTIAAEGLITNTVFPPLSSFSFSEIHLRPRKIPIKTYLIMVLMFWSQSVANNAALGFNISVPLHMLFRSGALLSTCVLGYFFFKKNYSPLKILSVFVVSAGVLVATFASGGHAAKSKSPEDEQNIIQWFIGVALLTYALFVSSMLGLYQSSTLESYKNRIRESNLDLAKDSNEAPSNREREDPNNVDKECLFWTHFLSIPFFLFTFTDIVDHVSIWINPAIVSSLTLSVKHPSVATTAASTLEGASGAAPNVLSEAGESATLITVSAVVLLVVANVVTQYFCANGVFQLLGLGSALTTTLVLSIRKFVSLVFSVLYFGHYFTLYHWLGTSLVFFGTAMYSFS